MHHYVRATVIRDDKAVTLNGVVPFDFAPNDNAGTGLGICQHATPHPTRAHTNFHYISAILPPQTKNALDSARKRRNIDANEITIRFYMRAILAMVVMAIGPLCGCADDRVLLGSARQPLGENLHLQTMMVLSHPPIIAATTREDLPVAARVAANAGSAELSKRESARWVGIDALPFLTSTDSGRQFLASTFPRALARGMPARSCPVAAVAVGAPGAARDTVAGEALQSCLAKITPAQSGCGCRIVALDDLVTVPQDEISYATGTSARMRSAPLGIDLLLVAEETVTGETLLRDLHGPVAQLAHGENNRVTLNLLSIGRQFNGYRIPVGFRRGRIAERIYAIDTDGNHLSLLIGFEPDELADSAGAWLAWRPEG
jgi:hypothetical protein